MKIKVCLFFLFFLFVLNESRKLTNKRPFGYTRPGRNCLGSRGSRGPCARRPPQTSSCGGSPGCSSALGYFLPSAPPNECTARFGHMTPWERTNIIVTYGITDGSFYNTLAISACSKGKCDPSFAARLFRSISFEKTMCCRGFMGYPTDHGCPRVIPRRNIPDVLKYIGATEFYNAVMLSEVQFPNFPITVFAPSNNALETMPRFLGRARQQRKAASAFVNSHIVRGLIYSNSFSDEEVIETIDGDTIRVRVLLDGGIPAFYVNCALLLPDVDQVSTQGVVHMIDRPIPMPDKDLLTLIGERPELTQFYEALELSGILYNSSTEYSHTVFAPTNDAMKKIAPELLNEIFSDSERLTAFIKQHMTNFTVCSAMLDSNTVPCTLVGNRLNVSRANMMFHPNYLTINMAEMQHADIIAVDGVLHIIGGAWMPEQALLMSQIFDQETLLYSVLKKTNLTSLLYAGNNMTFFAPSESAIQKLLDNPLSIDSSWLRNIMMNHVIYSEYLSHDFTNIDGNPIPLFHEAQKGDNSEIAELRHIVGLMRKQCSKLLSKDITAANGNIHEVDKVLVVPEDTVWDLIKKDPRLSIFTKAARQSNMKEMLMLLRDITLFVPTNDAFHALSREDFQTIMNDPLLLRKTVKYHVATDHLCFHDVRSLGFPPPWYTLTSGHVDTLLYEAKLRIRCELSETFINGHSLIEADHVAENGVVHVIDGVLVCPDQDSEPNETEEGIPSFFDSVVDDYLLG